jgi:hypothetical protein
VTPRTARYIARHGVKRGTLIISPWSGRLLPVVAAREVGCHVEITSEFGATFLVDAGQKVEQEARK